jgi:hypothetical protein
MEFNDNMTQLEYAINLYKLNNYKGFYLIVKLYEIHLTSPVTLEDVKKVQELLKFKEGWTHIMIGNLKVFSVLHAQYLKDKDSGKFMDRCDKSKIPFEVVAKCL